MGKVLIKIGTVVEVENKNSTNGADALRVRVKLNEDKYDESKPVETLPWAFPLLPKTLQSVPKKGEAVLVVADALDEFSEGQRYYIGPLISQPQYQNFCKMGDATTVLQASKNLPIGRISSNDATSGSFPKANDVALVTVVTLVTLVTVEWWDCCRPLYISKLALSSGYLLQDNTTRTTDV